VTDFLSPGETDFTVAVRNVDGHRLMFETLGIPLDSPVVSLDTLSLPLEYDAFLYSDLRSDDLPDGNLSTKLPNRAAETGLFTVRINLAYTKNRILRELETILTELKTLYHGYLKESKQEEHTQRRKLHLNYYEDYLEVYDLRQEGKSWSEITTLLDLNTIQTARNHYRAACERIEKGLNACT
jgi:hypothetical protein